MNTLNVLAGTVLVALVAGCTPYVPPTYDFALGDDPGLGFTDLTLESAQIPWFPHEPMLIGDTLISHGNDGSWELLFQDYRNWISPKAPEPFLTPFWPGDQTYYLKQVCRDTSRNVVFSIQTTVNQQVGYVVADFARINQPRRRLYFTLEPNNGLDDQIIVGLYGGYLLVQQHPAGGPDTIVVYNLAPRMDQDSLFHPLAEMRVGAFVTTAWRSCATAIKGQYLFVGRHADSDADMLEVYDLGNPAQPLRVAEVAGVSVNSMMISGNTLICRDNSHLFSLDVSNPARPKTGMGIGWRILYSAALRDGILYALSDYNQYLDVMDVSDPQQWKHLRRIRIPGSFDTFYPNLYLIGDYIVSDKGWYLSGNRP